MQTENVSRTSLFGLIGELREEAKVLVKQEVQLAKTEMTEKFSKAGRNAAWLAIGGAVAYAGLIVLLVGLGFLISFAFQAMGLSPGLTFFIGPALVGLLVAATGGLLVLKALRTLSNESLAPEKTLDTLKHTRNGREAHEPAAEHMEESPLPRLSSDQLQANVNATQTMMEETAAELRRRLSWPYIRRNMESGVRRHPVEAALIGLAAGLAGVFMIRRRKTPPRRVFKLESCELRPVRS